jgi:hypothetical protein
MTLRHTDPLLCNDSEPNETRAIACQRLRKYATVLDPLLSSGQRVTMEVFLEAAFSMGPLRGYISGQTELSLVSHSH